MKNKLLIRRMCIIAVLSAVSTILYLPFLRIKLPFIFPDFLELQFSTVPAIIATFAYGPLVGIIITAIKTILKILLVGSSTAYVGDIADFIIGASVVLCSCLIYKKKHTKKGADLSLFFGAVVWVAVAAIINYFILVPFYINLFWAGNESSFVEACLVIRNININNYKLMYLLAGCIPFNLVLSTLVMITTSLIYKKLSFWFKKIEDDDKK